jgi:glycosyltransferase involved in cell wall biosynthesis
VPTSDLSILIISYFFPPNAGIGGKRAARFCKYLPEFGIRPIVLTVDEASCGVHDTSFQLPSDMQIERVRPRASILKWYHRRAESKAAAVRPLPRHNDAPLPRQTGHFYRLWPHVFDLLEFPDGESGWYRPARRAAKQIIKDFRVDAVLSSGPPWTSHAVANSVSRDCDLPWVADFRDAWVSDPWRKYAYESRGITAWREKLDSWVEDRWVRHAGLVVCTTSQHRDALLQAHPQIDKGRVIIIPNGFESSHVDAVRLNSGHGPRCFLHAGSLYRDRNVSLFCRAVESLISSGRLKPDGARFILMGDAESYIQREALISAPSLFERGIISFHPRVEWGKAQQSLGEADVLLIFQGHHPTAIPAKFYEYLQTGKPILAIVGSGALRDVVIQTGSGFVADPDDQFEIESAIEQAFHAEARTPDEVRRVANLFEFRSLTARLAAGIGSLLGQDTKEHDLRRELP